MNLKNNFLWIYIFDKYLTVLENPMIICAGVGVIVIIIENGFDRVQILDEAVCILYCTNILGKHMKRTILPPSMSK